MEAVNDGESAEVVRLPEIVKLPNLKTFQYLRRHYNQQSETLAEAVFPLQSWELVRPEI